MFRKSNSLLLFTLLLGSYIFILSGCSSTASEIPKEFEELRPDSLNQYYIIGFQKNDWELEGLNRDIELFIKDPDVIGLTMFYKVSEESNLILKKYNYNLSIGFVVLEKEGVPYYVTDYHNFKSKKVD
ncbi:hypothetical protein H1D32_23010 [Anaerobacillus sp. CMMVII]|uniref:hypothetical protein n=1 Tax=Anaerobacillus sp. CMMVII TaxID=2755588 RepID=UPI0021B7176E|nr:hypothetical protein [Anaerobacillus sp. CMMVII]MCT8140314.1 hypothetical protein [Anaerobacillus sp. CMMVII]